jgi:hypothetical protein
MTSTAIECNVGQNTITMIKLLLEEMGELTHIVA